MALIRRIALAALAGFAGLLLATASAQERFIVVARAAEPEAGLEPVRLRHGAFLASREARSSEPEITARRLAPVVCRDVATASPDAIACDGQTITAEFKGLVLDPARVQAAIDAVVALASPPSNHPVH